jgi:hypothetical protein
MMTTDDSEAPGSEGGQQQGAQFTITYNSAGRFPKWIALSVMSLIAWLATLGGLHRHQMDRAEKWAISATTISLVFAILGVLCYLFSRGLFMGELPEIVLVRDFGESLS